jgi:two-component system, chemotaxis family, protein-glutamate methylesterase/glutaminase
VTKPHTVMVVDDASMMRTVVRQAIEASGRYQVVAQHPNGLKALWALKDVAPDVILLDVEMPVMDGATFLRHARVKTRAKIVVLSAASALGSANARTLREAGADAIADKPAGSVSPDLGADSPLVSILDRLMKTEQPNHVV